MLSGLAIVDCHHHIGQKVGAEGTWEFSGADLVKRMDRFGVAQAIVKHFVSALSTLADFSLANRYVKDAVTVNPRRLVGAVVVNPLFGNAALEEIQLYRREGFRGVKLHPVFHGYYHVNSGVADDVAALAGDLNMPVYIHSDFKVDVCSPYQIANLASRFPHTNFVMLHMVLYPPMVRFVPQLVKDLDNVFLDISETPDSPQQVIMEPVRFIGSSRLLFGTDGPEYHVGMYLHKVELAISEYGLSHEDAMKILGGNARQLFGLEDVSYVG